MNHKRVIYNNDGFSMFFPRLDNVLEALHSAADRFKDTDVEALDWCPGPCDVFTHDTKVGDVFGVGVEEFPRPGDKRAYQAVQELIKGGNDPLRVIVERGHEAGIKVFASFRMNANYGPPYDGSFNGRFWREHPEFRIVGKDGVRHYRLSYAFPDVRAYRMTIMHEVASYDVDGITLDFLRHPPFTGYEKPVVDGFRAEHGLDVRKLDPTDERVTTFRARYLTEFLQELRSALDTMGEKRGCPYVIAIRTEQKRSAEWGIDLEGWVEERLFDIFIPHSHGRQVPYSAEDAVRLAAGTGISVYPGIEATIEGEDERPGDEEKGIVRSRSVMNTEGYRVRALEFYEKGADGVYIFNNPYGRYSLNELGDPARLRRLVRGE